MGNKKQKKRLKLNELETYDDLKNFMDGKEYGHTEYCHYTTLDTIDKIITNKYFLLSPCVKSFNDDLDKKQFKEDKTYFALCFSTGITENLPMWYLYAGKNGRGGRIRMNSTYIKKLIDKGRYMLCEEKNKKIIPVMDLVDGETMNKTFYDVLYWSDRTLTRRHREYNARDKKKRYKKGYTIDLKYNGNSRYAFSNGEFKRYQKTFNGFLKTTIWSYEKETRLLVKLIGEAEKYCKKNTDRSYYIRVLFDDEIYNKGISIDLAPEIIDINIRRKNIEEFGEKTKRLFLSESVGKVSLSQCKNCEEKTNNKDDKTNKEVEDNEENH